MKHLFLSAWFCILAALPVLAQAAADAEIAAAQLLDRLNSPAGIAVRPGGSLEEYEVYFSERGAEIVSKIRSNEPSKAMPVIRVAESNAAGFGPASGLMFIGPDRIVLGTQSHQQTGLLRSYELTESRELPVSAEEHQEQVDLSQPVEIPPGRDGLPPVSVLRTRANDRVPDLVLAFTQGTAQASKVLIRAGTLNTPEPFFQFDSPAAPVCAAITPQGYLVAAQAVDNARSTSLSFINTINGRLVMRRTVNVAQVRGLAYSSETGGLYAAVFGPDGGEDLDSDRGIYRIDEVGPGAPCRAVPIHRVPRPTGLAFAPDGALYVIAAGRPGSRPASGVLLKLTGDL